MYPIDTSNKCLIYDSYFLNDLEDHTVDDIITDSRTGSSDDIKCRLTYNTKSPSNIIIKYSEIQSLINLHTVSDIGNNWMPAIISHDNYINSKEVLFGNVIANKQLGIEKCITVQQPKFKNWTLTEANGSGDYPGELSIDWIINSNLTYLDIEYGVMFWYKKNTNDYLSTNQYKLSDFPNFTVIQPTADISVKVVDSNGTESSKLVLSKTDFGVKIDNNTIKNLNKDHVTWNSDGTVNFNQQEDIVDMTKAIDSASIRFYSYYNKNFIGQDSNVIMPDYQMWISNGEFFSYFYNAKDKYDLKSHRGTKLPSRSYLSPCLYHIYRSIYNILTINRVRSSTSIGTVCYAEKLKKLCYILATSPLIDRTTINYLYHPTILTDIATYLNAASPTSSPEEITELLNIVNKITKTLDQLTSKIDNQNNSTNYIRNNSQLYNKLKSKYNANLYFDTNKNITMEFGSRLSNGPQAYFDLNYKTFCNKNGTPAVIYNKFEYTIGDMSIKNTVDMQAGQNPPQIKHQMVVVSSNLDPAKKAEIPWDVSTDAKPEKFRINIGADIVKPMDPSGETKIDYRWSEDTSNDLSCTWRLVDGPPCLRFSNYTKNGRIDFIKRNIISNDINPSFYINNDGVYSVECQITKSSVMKSTDTLRLYIGNCDQTVAPRTNPYIYTDTIASYKAFCNNIRQFALHKQGILWIIDSDIYNKYAPGLDTVGMFVDPSRLINTKIPLGFESQIGSDARLKINFETLNTKIKFNSIRIEHMRDGNANRSKCKSFYQEKIIRLRERVFGPYINAARYYRMGLAQDNLVIAGNGVDAGDTFEVRREYSFPEASTLLSPDIKSYGGYSNTVINTIGVEIPFHPVYDDATSKTISVKKLSSGLWGNGGSAENNIIAKKPARLPRLDKRNYMEGAQTKIRCSLMDIPINGYTTLSKGYFHPNSGWYPSSTTAFNGVITNNIGSSAYSNLNSNLGANITSVKRYSQSEYDSLYLRGYGIFDMRGATSGIQTSYNTYQSRILLKASSDLGIQYRDHVRNHGYRNVNGISYKGQENIDDFYLDEYLDREIQEDFICSPILNDSLYNGIPTSVYAFDSNSSTYNLDTLTLQDLELKLNFLNYPNPRNVIISLEIFNSSASPSPDFSKIFINNSKTTPNITELQNYISRINTENTSSNTSSRIIYLLNQEAIDNYTLNFNLLFSDNYSKFAILGDYNKYNKPTSYHCDVIHSDNAISPTLSTNTFSDENSTIYKKNIQNNFLPVTSASLAKFKNIPLKNTSFVLKITILGSEDKLLMMDNVVNNSELIGLSSYDTKLSSNSIANSLCSWDLIIHTKPTKKFHNKNYRGHFDYDNNSSSVIKGYNFIADFTDKEYLIPKVNMNAPYNYLANINYYCRYTNDDELSKPLTYRQLFFPFVFYSFTPFFTLVGALVAAWEISAQLAIGGRGDPLINFLYDLKFRTMQEELERNYFQPGYEAVAQGYSDKALVLLSQDKINWYKVEIPIYKYNNSDILKLKKYKYVKLSTDVAKPLCTFKFNLISDINDIVSSSSIKYTFTDSVITNGLTQYDLINDQQITLTFSEGDIVELTGQRNASDNGLYVVKTGSWVKFPDIINLAFLVNNKYYNTATNNITKENIDGKKIIAIKGSRASHFFDANNSISLSQNLSLENPVSGTVSDKYVINFGDSVYTILVLSSPLQNITSGYAYRPNNNMILVYSDNETFNDDSQISKWALEKSSNELDTIKLPNFFHSAMGEGNYGYGTPYLNPDVYSTLQLYDNSIEQVYNMLNNNINDKYKYNTIFLTDSSNSSSSIVFDPVNDSPNQLLQAYPFTINDYEFAYNTAGCDLNVPTGISTQDKTNLLLSIGNSTIQKDNQSFYFMDLKSDKLTSISNSGTISFENDYIKYIPIQKLSDSQLTTINTRLSFISTTGIISSELMSKAVNEINNIPDLLTYYNNLSADPVECNSSSSTSNTNCKKRDAKKKLSELYSERIDLLTIKENDKKADGKVLPMISMEITEIDKGGGSIPKGIKVDYKSKNYYWFNIDPKQTCSLSDEAIPRILYQTEYKCSPIVEYYQYPECDSVCGSLSFLVGEDVKVTNDNSADITYISNIVDEEKAKYPDVSAWDTDLNTGHYPVTKKFFLSCENSSKDTLVTVTERYLYPKFTPPKIREGTIDSVFNLGSSDSLYLKFRIIPRKLKTIDSIYQRYLYDYYGNLGKDITPAPGGPFYNGLSVWRCFDFDPDSANFKKTIDPPPFFKVMNEMIFRAYFGSVDGIEHKNSEISDPKEFWEWIPYEYFDGPIIE